MIDLGPVPKTTPHLMADYLELALLYRVRDEISMSDAISFASQGQGDLEDVGDQDEDAFQEISSEEPNYSFLSSAEKNAREQEVAADWFRHIKYRASAFGDLYPFVLDGSNVFSVKAKLNEKHLIYSYLLLCSRLKIFKQQERFLLANYFERLCATVLQGFMVKGSTVRIFGMGSDDRKTHFGVRLKDAISKLAAELNEAPINTSIDAIATNNRGDGGLDIVGYTKLGDNNPSHLVFFGQCASRMTEWPEKQLEAHPIHWQKYIYCIHPPANLVFIPVCFRGADGAWADSNKVTANILFDRLRICNTLAAAPMTAVLPTVHMALASVFLGDSVASKCA